MNCARYQHLRMSLGTQEQVSAMLGIHRVTLARRETGKIPITKEMTMALGWLYWKRTREETP